MIRFFAAHPTAGNLLMVAFMLAGIMTVTSLRRETLPRIEPRRVSVTVAYPGARPEDVEEAICRRLEDAAESVEHVHKITCEAREGRGQAVIEMTEGEDLGRFLAKVKTEVDAIDDFPDKAEAPIVEELGATDYVVSLAVTGFADRAHLKAYALAMKDRMLQWGGISQVEIKGFSERQIRIELPDATLRQFGLSIADIANTIARQSLDLPGGTIEAADQQITVRFADERKRVGEFLDLVVVSGPGGGVVRLGDIARISDRFSLDEDKITFNGRPAALLEVYKTAGEDLLRAVDAARAFAAHEQGTAPPGIAVEVTNDVSSIVRDRLNLLIKNGAQGLALVFLTMWLFFGLRYSFWVAMGLPVSFLGALALMAWMDYSLNMLTMVGLLIAIGLLMDDAIVISENIARHREQGKSPLDAAVAGAGEVFPSVFASFLTTAMVLGSVVFLRGDIGQILRVVPVVMLFVLSVSLVEAFLILPGHLMHSLDAATARPSRFRARVEAALDWLRERLVGRFVDLCLRWRYLTFGCAIALLLAAVSMLAGGVLKFAAFPDLDGDIVEARILLPQGTPLARTEAVAATVRGALDRLNARLTPAQPGGQSLVRNITVQFNKNVDAYEAGSHIATVTADLLSAEVRATSSDEVVAQWRRETGALPDVVALKFTESVIGPGGLAIDIRLKGTDLAALKGASREWQDWLGRFAGVTDLSDDLRPGKREFRLRLKEQAGGLGLGAREVAEQLRTALYGTTVSEIQVGPESFEIDVRLDRADRDSPADLDYFTIATAVGALVPLNTVAELTAGRGHARINRDQRVRTVTVRGDVDRKIANADAVIAAAKARFLPEFSRRHPGIAVEFGGQNEEGAKTQRSMVAGFAIGLIGVFLLLSFQFRSYVEPIVVMVVIPLAFIGAVFGHLAMGLDFTMPSMFGFVALAGVVVNNSILLVNFIKEHHATHGTVAEAAPLAARARFRAILITTLTTLAGLLPILTETSLQAQILIPMVASLAFGLLASVLMVLFVVPALYAILDDFGLSTLARERRANETAPGVA